MHVEFEVKGYRILRELSRNRQGGRITYLAANSQEEQFAIKEFLFAQKGSDWSVFKLLQREIDILKYLNHPQIPQYVEAFEIQSGFCLVQQYIESQSLAAPKPRTLAQVKRIARQILEILCYLQACYPPVFHRDLKPENLLEDEQGSIYLVDFGFARLGGFEMAVSSMVVGTTGFMPPEQLLGRELTCASDLYSLGVTLVCLLTGIPSSQVNHYLDEQFQFNEHVFSNLEPPFVIWLKKLMAARVSDRFPNASTALVEFDRLEENSSTHNTHAEESIQPEAERGANHTVLPRGTPGLIDTEQFLARSVPRWPKF